jgi:phosphotransferase system enzyme I (PtsI)
LYRTEVAFAVRGRFPTEDEQYEFLARTAARMHPHRVVLRILDMGGDKELPYFPLRAARNPSLALRGIRMLLTHPEILKRQLRAFLRASADHNVSVLVPVVGGVEDVRHTREVIRQVGGELAAEGVRFNPEVPVGAMIEVPSAALMANSIAREADFLSLGTSDLVQYVHRASNLAELTPTRRARRAFSGFTDASPAVSTCVLGTKTAMARRARVVAPPDTTFDPRERHIG